MKPSSWIVVGLALLLGHPPARGQDIRQKPSAELFADLLSSSDRKVSHGSAVVLNLRIDEGGPEGDQATGLLLDRRAEVTDDPGVKAMVDGLVGRGEGPLAAKFLVQVARARSVVRGAKRGHVVVGRVVVADGRLDPGLVLAQMPILRGGYFAGEVADLDRPIGFRAARYEGADVSLKGREGPVICVGDVTLRPVAPDRRAGLRGRLVPDDPASMTKVMVRVLVDRAPINTPSGGYASSERPPESVLVPASPSGDFLVEGLAPGAHRLVVAAQGHVATATPLTLRPGQVEDAGTIRLKAHDPGHYLKGKTPPPTGELPWEKDYPAALKRARAEKKPLMIMMTATWCGPCKTLEKETLNDPWVRSILSDFVIVQSYEDEAVEARYGVDLYPTLIFADPDGKEAHRTRGHLVPLPFLAAIAPAFAKLGIPLRPELQELIDKKAIDPDRR